MKTKSSEEVVPIFSPLTLVDFGKKQSPDFEVKLLLSDVVKMKYVNSLKTQSLDFKSRQIKRFTGSNPAAPFGLGIFGTFKARLLMMSK